MELTKSNPIRPYPLGPKSTVDRPRLDFLGLALMVGWLGALGLFGSGCYAHRAVVSGVEAAAEPSYDRWRHHFLFGLIDPNDEVGLREVCPAGIAVIEHEQAPLNVLVSWVTAFIYTPTTVRVYCQKAESATPLDQPYPDP